MTTEGCCGSLGRGRKRRTVEEALPDNPVPERGVKMIYLGSGRADIKNMASGFTYVVADYRRHFRAHPDDVQVLLRSRKFILQP